MLRIITIAFLLFSFSVNATVLWDFSPESTDGKLYGPDQYNIYNSSWSNNFYSQHYEQINFTNDVSLTGVDLYYSRFAFIPIIVDGDWSPYKTNLIIREDLSGTPGEIIVSEKVQLTGTKGLESDLYAYVEAKGKIIRPVTLEANKNYWISFYGIPTLGIMDAPYGNNSHKVLITAYPDNPFAQFNGYTTVQSDLAFRLYGNAISVPVPEPGTYALLVLGLGLLSFTARRT